VSRVSFASITVSLRVPEVSLLETFSCEEEEDLAAFFSLLAFFLASFSAFSFALAASLAAFYCARAASLAAFSSA